MSEASIDGTGAVPERFDPGSANPPLMRAEHWSRYHLAAQLAPGKRVLDAGCGTGYGTNLLRKAGAAEVVGIDLSSDALDAARVRNPGLQLLNGDLSDSKLPPESFDLIACFEVIEHLESQEAALDELSRLLVPDGVLLVSSPNPIVYPAGNPHHVRELTPVQLEEMLARRFTNVEMVRQHGWLASAILPTELHEDATSATAWPSNLAKVSACHAGAETYTLAVASNAAVPSLTAVVTLARAGDLEHYAAAIKALEDRVEDAFGAAQAAGERRSAADAEAERAINLQRELEDRLRSTQNHLERANEAIERITGSLSWRLTAPLRRLRNRS